MSRVFYVQFSACVMISLAFGCATTRTPEEPPNPFMGQAIRESFSDMFDGSRWKDITVYVERNEHIVGDIRQAGLNPAEVIDRLTLMENSKYSKVAPALAVLDTQTDPEGLIHVCIVLSPVKTRDWQQVEIKGGTFQYVYQVTGNKLTLRRATRSFD